MINTFKKYLAYLWNSQTFTTWGVMVARMSGTIVVIPLILRHLSTGETAIWFLFFNIINLGNLADFGFSTTFVRLSAYAMGGATRLDDFRDSKKGTVPSSPNWQIMEKLYGNFGLVY